MPYCPKRLFYIVFIVSTIGMFGFLRAIAILWWGTITPIWTVRSIGWDIISALLFGIVASLISRLVEKDIGVIIQKRRVQQGATEQDHMSSNQRSVGEEAQKAKNKSEPCFDIRNTTFEDDDPPAGE